MPILTDSIIDVGNYITFNIGLSKSISNYTADEIWNFPYCSSSWNAFRHVCDESYAGIAPGTLEASEYQMPFHFTGVNQMYEPATYNFEEGQIEYNQGDDGIYGKIIWLCVTGDTSIGHIFDKQRCITNTDGVKIITQMDMTQVYLYLDTFADPANHDPMFLDYDNFKIKENHDGVTTYEHARNASIFPAVMFKYNDKLYIHRIFQNSYVSLDWAWWLSYYGDSEHGGHTEIQGHQFNAQPVSFDNSKTAYLPINIMRQFSGLRPTNTERFFTMSDIEDVGVRYQWMYGYDGGRICPATVQKYLEMASWYGCKFYHNGTYYKPIITDGYVEGYTDNMNAPSDIDNWIGATNHNVPPNPPHGGGGDDEEIDMPLSQHATTSGFVHYYSMTYANIVKTASALNRFDISLIGKDLLRNIISYKLFAISPANLINSSTNVIVHIAGHELKDEQDNYITGDVIESLKTIPLGSIKINEHFGDFRDYAPYTKLEIYVPFCGWATLPPWCMGKTLSGEMFIDLPNGTVKAVIKSSKTVVAELGGCCSVDIPFAAESTGAKTAAVISKIANTAAAVASGSIPAIGTSSISLIGAINANYTDMQGVCGDGSNLNGLDYVYVKVSRPSDEFKTIPSQYKHQYGLPCNKEITLAEGDGYTQVNDANVVGTMTAKEKQMIIDGFRHGLIL